jgi:hypothetical protein
MVKKREASNILDRALKRGTETLKTTTSAPEICEFKLRGHGRGCVGLDELGMVLSSQNVGLFRSAEVTVRGYGNLPAYFRTRVPCSIIV